jgi:hypothetical protein
MAPRLSLRHWREAPFSFVRMWLDFAIIFGLLTFPFIFVAYYIAPHFWLGPFIGMFVWWITNGLFQGWFRDFIWKKMAQNFREAIPYDANESIEGKGTIRSYSSLFKWLAQNRRRRRSGIV